MQRTHRQSLRSFLFAAELDIVRQRERSVVIASLPYLITAVLAAAWGALGRVLLDWLLGLLGFNTSQQPSMLTFAVGPVWVWAAVAIVLWTPIAGRLQRATRTQALWLGVLVAALGVVVLYVLFVFQMGVPGSASEVLNTFAFFPLFAISAAAFGGFLAVPATLATALLLRVALARLGAASTSAA